MIKELKEKPELADKLIEILEKRITIRQLGDISTQIAALREDFNKMLGRIERLEEGQLALREDFNKMLGRIERLEEGQRRIEAEIKDLRVEIGSIGRRLGRGFEKVVLETYKDALERFGVKIEEIRRLKIYDSEGKVFPPTSPIEIDGYISDSKRILIEIKAFLETDDVTWFLTKVKRIEELMGLRAEKLIIAVEVTEEAEKLCKKLGIDLIYRRIYRED